MTGSAKPSVAEAQADARCLMASFGSLILATADSGGSPHASYAPYVTDSKGNFYIFVSQLAAHTRNLQTRPHASILFIENEQAAHNLFARKRLTCECLATHIPRDSVEWPRHLDGFVAKHGAFMEMLKGLPDFQLFRLTPERAVYVRGFGQAYDLTADQLRSLDSA